MSHKFLKKQLFREISTRDVNLSVSSDLIWIFRIDSETILRN